MEESLYQAILRAAGNRADQVAKVINDYLEADDDADEGQTEAEAEGPNAAIEGGEAEEAVSAEAQEPE